MPHLGSKIAVALLTFTVGVAAVTLWLLYRRALPAGTPSSTERASQCLWQQRTEQELSRLYAEYEALEARPSVEGLVAIDGATRLLFESRPKYYPCGDDAEIWEEKYSKLGVDLDHWGLLAYSGKLLADAHRMNPVSEFRKSTLFSTVEPEHGFGVMPNVDAAHAYAREFPDGPFAETALLLIADFHKDLYMVLRDDLRDYKYDCFKPHIDRSPRAAQARRAQAKAVSYYEKVVKANPSNTSAAWQLEEVKKGTVRGWSFCAD